MAQSLFSAFIGPLCFFSLFVSVFARVLCIEKSQNRKISKEIYGNFNDIAKF